jgi:hypothetical protein
VLCLEQKTAEELEYSHLLDEAAAQPPRSVERILRVAAFAVSAYSGTMGRTAKPFNPLLGETYEFVCPERGFRWAIGCSFVGDSWHVAVLVVGTGNCGAVGSSSK